MKIKLSRNFLLTLAVDLLILAVSYYMGHLIRYDFNIPDWARQRFFETLAYVLMFKLICFYLFDVYRGMWRYTSLKDILDIVKASALATIFIVVVVLFATRFKHFSRSVFVIDWCFTVIGLTSIRVFTRLCFEEFSGDVGPAIIGFALKKIFSKKLAQKGRRMVIIGAGDCGQRVCREFKENPNVKSQVIGFLDDDKGKIGRRIHGVSVLNNIDNLEHTIRSKSVDEVIIAIPNACARRMRQIVTQCRQAGVEFKTVPDMGELIDGKITLNAIRNVEYRDLLGRQPVSLDQESIGEYLGHRIVMVTGAGGSIGIGLCRQICRYKPEQLILFERAESPLFEIDLELKKNFPDIDVVPILGDIQNPGEVIRIFSQYRPEIVFHAAAYKHVPMLEVHPWKAVENNIVGTCNLIEAARTFQCERFVFVSTDKAVNPTNVMGATKRFAELLIQRENSDTDRGSRFITVRFGNVIGSVGSVVPLFKKQIKEGGPVTVTHPKMIRYFMLIPEACQLILQAGAMGKGGEVYILEMGAPISIDTMARDLIRFSGFEPDVDIKIKYTGLRMGEKLYEELVTAQENVVPTAHKKIMVVNSCPFVGISLDNDLIRLKEAAAARDHRAIRTLLKQSIPEYQPFDYPDAGENQNFV
ncbi:MULTISPECIES: nucleoside-diphosphate sugar epimerase/dehydratase [unclassified Desulfobacter]|uniref:polysaccharide biosynthesis protein n=1 Tax=unclassified Desulfobacter TaxID=2634406 RepID=UPI000E8DCDE8|nr:MULTISPECIES: nucleoside-diphosphate sugar epimerase/dehydratase [unclassified Desulfobacter]HBT89126.1 polysaccharide biosynthesis protein [Desulfobacter sp.]